MVPRSLVSRRWARTKSRTSGARFAGQPRHPLELRLGAAENRARMPRTKCWPNVDRTTEAARARNRLTDGGPTGLRPSPAPFYSLVPLLHGSYPPERRQFVRRNRCPSGVAVASNDTRPALGFIIKIGDHAINDNGKGKCSKFSQDIYNSFISTFRS
ncbi:hypothetical protein PUN28_011322 [Cardiocondyla obscurior]|uniref:Uncharacterized protein n=1 Tax=Cardiocondyla obscurior TaxID=286306 RepID=A0AAW2FDF7_9HYME